jgi:hypothetical protein
VLPVVKATTPEPRYQKTGAEKSHGVRTNSREWIVK